MFEVTADFVVDHEGHWAVSLEGLEQNRVDPATEPTGMGYNFERAASEQLLPFLDREGRLLIVESSLVYPERPGRAPGERAPLRIVHRESDEGFEEYLLAPGPRTEAEVIDWSLTFGLPHRAVGAVVTLEEDDVPADGASITEEDLRRILSDVVALFVRLDSYDGYLLWKRTAR